MNLLRLYTLKQSDLKEAYITMPTPINPTQLKQLIEASLFVLAKPMTIKALKESVLADFSVSRMKIKSAVEELQQE